MPPDPTHDRATLISADRSVLQAFALQWGLPLRVAMVIGPAVDPANPLPITDQLLDGYRAKNGALAPWLGRDGKVYSPLILDQLIEKILSPPYPSVVILIRSHAQ